MAIKTGVTEFNILLAGVGGQGIILVSELLEQAATDEGLPVRGSEVLGMAVRGGPVTSKVRFGSDVYGPLIPMGKTDLMIAAEPLEALRNVIYMAGSGTIVLSTQQVVPVPVYLGKATYPPFEQIVAQLKEHTARVISIDARGLAKQAGSVQSANIVILGAAFATGLLPVSVDSIKKTVAARFKGKLGPLNIKAFDIGYEACKTEIAKSGK